jgi:hypothetical protein
MLKIGQMAAGVLNSLNTNPIKIISHIKSFKPTDKTSKFQVLSIKFIRDIQTSQFRGKQKLLILILHKLVERVVGHIISPRFQLLARSVTR